MELKVGGRLVDDAGTAEIIVTRLPDPSVSFRFDHEVDSAGAAGDVLLGKRYVDEETGTEFLCTKPGSGFLVVADRVMQVKQAKPLPSSD
jgi:hypothetical protein